MSDAPDKTEPIQAQQGLQEQAAQIMSSPPDRQVTAGPSSHKLNNNSTLESKGIKHPPSSSHSTVSLNPIGERDIQSNRWQDSAHPLLEPNEGAIDFLDFDDGELGTGGLETVAEERALQNNRFNNNSTLESKEHPFTPAHSMVSINPLGEREIQSNEWHDSAHSLLEPKEGKIDSLGPIDEELGTCGLDTVVEERALYGPPGHSQTAVNPVEDPDASKLSRKSLSFVDALNQELGRSLLPDSEQDQIGTCGLDSVAEERALYGPPGHSQTAVNPVEDPDASKLSRKSLSFVDALNQELGRSLLPDSEQDQIGTCGLDSVAEERALYGPPGHSQTAVNDPIQKIDEVIARELRKLLKGD